MNAEIKTQHPLTANQLFGDKILNCLGEFLTRFNQSMQFSSFLKDIKTEKTLMSNPVCSRKWGLTPQEMAGQTAKELFDRVKNFKNKQNILKKVEQADHEALVKGSSSYTYTILQYSGLVSIQNSTHVPIYNASEHPIAIFNVTQHLTPFTDLSYLFNVYRQYYPDKKEAIHYISDYLGLNNYFYRPLTCSELTTLLAMTQDTRRKSVSKLKKLSRRTIEMQCLYLKEKLKEPFDLYTVITYLRDLKKWMPSTDIY